MNQLAVLEKEYDRLQLLYGDPALHAIYYGGCTVKPKTCFVFMNPTCRNAATQLKWTGLRAPWIGTKNVWRLFWAMGFLEPSLYSEIQTLKPHEWTPGLAELLYNSLSEQGVYITNLAKCTQPDARPLPDRVYRAYLPLFMEELRIVQPQKIVAFGNQVSSLLLGRKISVSQCRKQSFPLRVGEKDCPLYPVFYPVGNGLMNLPKALEDLKEILT